MSKNNFVNRAGRSATSEMIMRNHYSDVFDVQNYVIVEGESDEKFFSRILDCTKCKIKNLEGKDNVIDYIKKYGNAGCYIGIVDADFDHINEKYFNHESLLYTDCHDIEMMIFASDLLVDHIWIEHGNELSIREFESLNDIKFLDAIMGAAYDIGVLKYVVKYSYGNNMKDIIYPELFDDRFNIDIGELIRRIKKKNQSEIEIQSKYEEMKKKGFDLKQITCGHDITAIMEIAFRDVDEDGLGFGNGKNITKDKIEQTLRNIYNYEEFKNTCLYKSLELLDKKRKLNMFKQK